MVIHVPGTIHLVGPDALQVGRQVARTAGGDEQVAAELVVERLQVVVGLSLAVVPQTLRGGDVLHLGSGVEGQLHALEEGLVVGQVILQQAVVAQLEGLVHPLGRGGRGVNAHVGTRVAVVGVEVNLIVGIGRDEEEHLVGLLHDEPLAVCAHLTTRRQGRDAYRVGHLVVVEACLVAE